MTITVITATRQRFSVPRLVCEAPSHGRTNSTVARVTREMAGGAEGLCLIAGAAGLLCIRRARESCAAYLFGRKSMTRTMHWSGGWLTLQDKRGPKLPKSICLESYVFMCDAAFRWHLQVLLLKLIIFSSQLFIFTHTYPCIEASRCPKLLEAYCCSLRRLGCCFRLGDTQLYMWTSTGLHRSCPHNC